MPNQKGVASPVFCRFSLFARSALKERGRPAHMFQPSGAGGLSLSENLRKKISAVRAFVFFPIHSQILSGWPPSLPLMSPFGLPSAGYSASARWHVFRFQISGFSPALRFGGSAGGFPAFAVKKSGFRLSLSGFKSPSSYTHALLRNPIELVQTIYRRIRGGGRNYSEINPIQTP